VLDVDVVWVDKDGKGEAAAPGFQRVDRTTSAGGTPSGDLVSLNGGAGSPGTERRVTLAVRRGLPQATPLPLCPLTGIYTAPQLMPSHEPVAASAMGLELCVSAIVPGQVVTGEALGLEQQRKSTAVNEARARLAAALGLPTPAHAPGSFAGAAAGKPAGGKGGGAATAAAAAAAATATSLQGLLGLPQRNCGLAVDDGKWLGVVVPAWAAAGLDVAVAAGGVLTGKDVEASNKARAAAHASAPGGAAAVATGDSFSDDEGGSTGKDGDSEEGVSPSPSPRRGAIARWWEGQPLYMLGMWKPQLSGAMFGHQLTGAVTAAEMPLHCQWVLRHGCTRLDGVYHRTAAEHYAWRLAAEHAVTLAIKRDGSSVWQHGRRAAHARIARMDVDSLLLSSGAPHMLMDSNRVECAACGVRTEHLQSSTMVAPPLHLAVLLARMQYSTALGKTIKIHDYVQLRPVLVVPQPDSVTAAAVDARVARSLADLRATDPAAADAVVAGTAGQHEPWCALAARGGCARAATRYGLFAVIMHAGETANSGHYFSFCRRSTVGDLAMADAPGNGWVKYNDTRVTPCTWADMVAEIEGSLSETAYMLLYHRLPAGDAAPSAAPAEPMHAAPAAVAVPPLVPDDVHPVYRASVDRDNAAALASAVGPLSTPLMRDLLQRAPAIAASLVAQGFDVVATGSGEGAAGAGAGAGKGSADSGTARNDAAPAADGNPGAPQDDGGAMTPDALAALAQMEADAALAAQLAAGDEPMIGPQMRPGV
jgi:hypothetical protein